MDNWFLELAVVGQQLKNFQDFPTNYHSIIYGCPLSPWQELTWQKRVLFGAELTSTSKWMSDEASQENSGRKTCFENAVMPAKARALHKVLLITKYCGEQLFLSSPSACRTSEAPKNRDSGRFFFSFFSDLSQISRYRFCILIISGLNFCDEFWFFRRFFWPIIFKPLWP